MNQIIFLHSILSSSTAREHMLFPGRGNPHHVCGSMTQKSERSHKPCFARGATLNARNNHTTNPVFYPFFPFVCRQPHIIKRKERKKNMLSHFPSPPVISLARKSLSH